MAESVQDLLSTIHIFAGLSDEVMSSLAKVCRRRHAEAGEVIVEQDAEGREMFVIARGEIEVIKHLGDPAEIRLAKLGPGEFFGEMSIIECMTRSATVRTTSPADLYSLRNKDLLDLFHRWPDQYGILMLNIARDLCRRLRALHETFAACSC